MQTPIGWRVAYERAVADGSEGGAEGVGTFLVEQLPWAWRDRYIEVTGRPADGIVQIDRGTFLYVYDTFPGVNAPDRPPVESRLVAAIGRSAPTGGARDDGRLAGWGGPTNTTYGEDWDKGHFIGHSLGCAVDRQELNVFLQRRDLNRGWSPEGRRYRAMEAYCADHAGTLCFSRPIYVDESFRPAFVEFGVLRAPADLWVECFDNRLVVEASL